MNPFLHPRWIFFSTVLPQLTLFIIYYNAFQVFGMQLDEKTISIWYIYGFSFLGIIIAQTAYAAYSTYHSKPVNGVWSVATVAIYLFLLLSYYLQAKNLVPRSVPDWIQGVTDVQSFMGMFIFPAILHAIIVAVVHFTDKKLDKANTRYHFWAVLAIPLSIYLSINLLVPFLNKAFSYKFSEFAMTILMSVVIISALFWLFRVVYLAYLNNKFPYLHKILEVLFIGAFPLLGLLLSAELDNPLGNFQSYWFFSFAVLAAIILIIPSSNLKSYKTRFIHFLLKAFVFPYTMYFLIVFMPFTPLSVILVIVGVGLLMLTPLILFLIHSQQLYQDYDYLTKKYSSTLLFTSFLIAVAIIPLAFSLNTYYDRIQLHKGLDYLYSSDYNENKNTPNPNSISATLHHIENFKIRRNRDWFNFDNNAIPLLDSFYKWLVLDNMTLSESKINLLNNVFVGENMPKSEKTWRIWNQNINQNRNFETGKGDNTVKIDSTKITSVFDPTQNAWRTQVDLVLHNAKNGFGRREYATFFDLPEGAFISNYYLYVGEEKVEALLAEKKTALWVYRQIVNTRKDPGILYYNDKGKIGFRVFPFIRNEYRKTGFEILHAEPFELQLDDYTTVFLGNENDVNYININLSSNMNAAPNCVNVEENSGIEGIKTLKTSNPNYISESELQDLKTITRKPYYHFVLDNSKYGGIGKEKYIERIENFVSNNPLQNSLESKYTVVDFEVNELRKNWKDDYLNKTNKGGFFLEKAIKRIWLENYLENLTIETSQKSTQPIIVVVSDELEDGVWTGSLHEWKKYVPEGFEFYELASNNRIMLQNFEHFKMLGEPVDKIAIKKVKQITKNEKTYFLPISTKNGITLPITEFEKKEEITSADIENFEKLPKYSQALALQNLNETMALYPTQAEKRWLEQVQKSFTARILTPVTTFMVLETEVQRKALLKKQEEVLSGKRLLDLTDARRSSEPSLWIFMAIFGILFLIKYRKI
ncbi:putative membrane protein, required for N-linked glycosylation [Bernardetia litoralis DSM 6794]|uniref:Putative membrane protein, required for N-linked glycosylation n=1 Tax=Bernardetia litoralis (strain ATCC 23117 / DSM 6794 / NBRC 15988 / NCIMB 1366 / Fx l1 / Sio-4) TaxID=880071 RepID=I4AJT7_BERLS|nr:MSEP-CTERM sorting domain-containing protein [Bernardetia litoralis]AFM04222.1 putative membrane protein, required for N-linked glycosylation [Bernardetia litoralis DSM 6794]